MDWILLTYRGVLCGWLPSKKGRWRGIGANVGGVICVVFAKLGSEGVSVISMRPASVNERKLYAEYLKE